MWKAIDYRLSPQFTFPAALHDMISAYMFLIDPPSGHPKYDPEQIVFSGNTLFRNL
jgi:acetyl esterase/lipase